MKRNPVVYRWHQQCLVMVLAAAAWFWTGEHVTWAQPVPKAQVDLKDPDAIEQRMLDDLQYLASDEMQGRGIRTRGLELAADYIVKQFEAVGLETNHFNGQPFQVFQTYETLRLGDENEATLSIRGGRQWKLNLSQDYVPLASGTSGQFNAPLAFVGYGITAPDLGYDDYQGIDVQGKAVIVLRHEPRQADAESVFAGTGNSPHAYLTNKINNAVEHGAAAVLLCSDKVHVDKSGRRGRGAAANKPNGDQLLSFRTRPKGIKPQIPVLHVTRLAIDVLLAQTNRPDLAALEAEIDRTMKPVSFIVDKGEFASTVVLHSTPGALKNVVGVLPGTGDLADETVIVGAHYDHLGMNGGLLAPWTVAVHNGADDNGSGTTGLLEIARQVTARATSPRRRIVFIAFSAEEVGLVGSAYYVRHPLFSLKNTMAMVNLDMVGRLRNERLTVSGVGTATELSEMVSRLAEPYTFKLQKDPSGYGPSDHASFYEHGVPVLHFFTGLHADYHRPSDDVEKINFAGIRRIALMASDVVLELAQREKPLTKRTGSNELENLLLGDLFGETRPAKPRASLGVRIEDVKEPVEGIKVIEVMEGSAAADAQLQLEDIIQTANGKKIVSIRELQAMVRAAKPGDELKLDIRRGEIDLEMVARLKATK